LYCDLIPGAVNATFYRKYDSSLILMYLMNDRLTKLLNAFAREIINYRGTLDYDTVIQELKEETMPKIVRGGNSEDNNLNSAAFYLKDCIADIARLQKAQEATHIGKGRLDIQEDILQEAGFKHRNGSGTGYGPDYQKVGAQYSEECWKNVETTLKPLFK